jgi:hypothetical protein
MEIGRGTVGCVLTLFQNNAAEYCKVLCCIQETELEFLNTMGAWNRLGIGLSYRPAMLRRLAEFILVYLLRVPQGVFCKGGLFRSFTKCLHCSVKCMGRFNPFLFIRGLSFSVQTSLTQNCLKLTTCISGFPCNLIPVSFGGIGFSKKS